MNHPVIRWLKRFPGLGVRRPFNDNATKPAAYTGPWPIRSHRTMADVMDAEG